MDPKRFMETTPSSVKFRSVVSGRVLNIETLFEEFTAQTVSPLNPHIPSQDGFVPDPGLPLASRKVVLKETPDPKCVYLLVGTETYFLDGRLNTVLLMYNVGSFDEPEWQEAMGYNRNGRLYVIRPINETLLLINSKSK